MRTDVSEDGPLLWCCILSALTSVRRHAVAARPENAITCAILLHVGGSAGESPPPPPPPPSGGGRLRNTPPPPRLLHGSNNTKQRGKGDTESSPQPICLYQRASVGACTQVRVTCALEAPHTLRWTLDVRKNMEGFSSTRHDVVLMRSILSSELNTGCDVTDACGTRYRKEDG